MMFKGERVKQVEAVNKIIAREVSLRYVLEPERLRFADLVDQGMSASQIASELGRTVSWVSCKLDNIAQPRLIS